VGRNFLGDPRIALTWLANELSLMRGRKRGRSHTGTFVSPWAIAVADRIEAISAFWDTVSCDIA